MRVVFPLRDALSTGPCKTGTSIRKFTFTSANGAVGSRSNFSVFVEPSSVMLARFPFVSRMGIQPNEAQPVVGIANVPRKFVVCVVVPHPLVTIERMACDVLAEPHANRPQTLYLPPG